MGTVDKCRVLVFRPQKSLSSYSLFPSLGSDPSTTLSGSSYPFLFTVGTYSLPLPKPTARIISGPSRDVNHRIINLKLYQVAQGHVQSNLEHLQGQRLLNPLSAPIPGLQSAGISLATAHGY